MIRFTILFFACFLFICRVDPVLADNEEVRALRKEVAELRKMVEKLTRAQEVNMTEIAEIKPKPRTDFDTPSLNIQGFGNLQFDYANQSFSGKPDDNTNHFTTGDVGLMITSQIARKLSLLNETLFEFRQGGGNNLEVERVLLKYEYTNWLNFSLGREHTPLGYWNQQFHHATWMLTTTDRPIIYRFEDENGILPTHYVGLGVFGNLESNFADIGYSVFVGNGRGKVANSVQVIDDLNNDKQVGFKFTLQPYALDGFGAGTTFLYDVIPNNPDIVGRENEIDEIIAGAHLFYTLEPYELIAEYKYIRHDDSRAIRSHHGGYLQLAYSIDKFKPYYRLDFLSIDSSDLFFAGIPGAEDSIQHTIGLRYEWFPFAAIKLEYRRLDSNTVDSNAVTSQISFIY